MYICISKHYQCQTWADNTNLHKNQDKCATVIENYTTHLSNETSTYKCSGTRGTAEVFLNIITMTTVFTIKLCDADTKNWWHESVHKSKLMNNCPWNFYNSFQIKPVGINVMVLLKYSFVAKMWMVFSSSAYCKYEKRADHLGA